MEHVSSPTLEDMLKYSQAKAILKAPCIVFEQLDTCLKTIADYEKQFNIPEKERFKSEYITRFTISKETNEQHVVVLLEPLLNQPKAEPIVVELVAESDKVLKN